MQDRPLTLLRDATLVVAACAAVAVGVNLARPDGLALVAAEPHRVVVPCPGDKLGPASPMQPSDPLLSAAGTLLVDARDGAEYAQWHVDGAVSLTYDLLEETPEYRSTIADLLVTHADARRVVVYGDDQPGLETTDGRPGDAGGTGFLLAGALSRQGMRNVSYVLGGAAALRAALGGGP
jgi:hypothetical protein